MQEEIEKLMGIWQTLTGVSETITTEQATGHSTEEHRFWKQANFYKVCKDGLSKSLVVVGSVVLKCTFGDGPPRWKI